MPAMDGSPNSEQPRRSVPLYRLRDFADSSDLNLAVIETLDSAFARVRSNVHTPHRHDFYEIFIVRSGTVSVWVDGSAFHIETPSLCLFPPGTVHCWEVDPHLTGFVLRVPMAALPTESTREPQTGPPLLGHDPRIIPLSAALLWRLDAIAHWLHHESASAQPQSIDILRAQLQLLVLELARAVCPKHTQSTVTDRMLAARFRQLVEEHYRKRWTIPQYSVSLRVGRSRLSRIVQEVLGNTPAQVIQDRLLAEAMRLVAYTDRRLGEIADDLGFPSQAYFCRVFRQAAGLPPSAFRLLAQSDNQRGESDNRSLKNES
jgi:AraC family transcriptional regulator, transcriptional activator of pobA